MGKRKSDTMAMDTSGDGADSDSDSSPSLIDVDFDYFDPSPTTDCAALKRMLIQLFGARDAETLGAHPLAELVLQEGKASTTIKTDGIESDPYAFISVLDLVAHAGHPSIKALVSHLRSKSNNAPVLQAVLAESAARPAWIFSERLINMPVQVMPPMYNMLLDELSAAQQSHTHYLFISRAYHMSPAADAALQAQPQSRGKPGKRAKTHVDAAKGKPAQRPADGVYSFHPEDEVIMKHASYTHTYVIDDARSKDEENDAFGLDLRGRIMLVPADKLRDIVKEVGETYSVGV
ncbi:hypothetical protein PLICRDRAFT_37839 [Plicaturopsis crispa FD-325 SS-3]|nr:hypothetical protein PLICRDRAFT_37839 [Plicaturopsis crispa FD-325 SS-3]